MLKWNGNCFDKPKTKPKRETDAYFHDWYNSNWLLAARVLLMEYQTKLFMCFYVWNGIEHFIFHHSASLSLSFSWEFEKRGDNSNKLHKRFEFELFPQQMFTLGRKQQREGLQYRLKSKIAPFFYFLCPKVVAECLSGWLIDMTE